MRRYHRFVRLAEALYRRIGCKASVGRIPIPIVLRSLRRAVEAAESGDRFIKNIEELLRQSQEAQAEYREAYSVVSDMLRRGTACGPEWVLQYKRWLDAIDRLADLRHECLSD